RPQASNMPAHSKTSATSSSAGSTAFSCSAPWVRERASRLDRSVRHERQTVDRSQHTIEFVAAPHDQAGCRNHAIGTLAARQLRVFFDAIERHFRAAAEHRENRAVFEKIDGVISPLAGCDLAPIQIENAIELAAAESYLTYGGGCRADRGTTPEGLAGVDFAGTERHAAPPLLWPTMIALAAMDGKHFLVTPNGKKNVRNRPPNDHELVKPSHNNAQFRSIAG